MGQANKPTYWNDAPLDSNVSLVSSSLSSQVEMVLWFLAEGLDQVVMIRVTGNTEAPIARWLERAGTHSQA